MTWLSKPHLGLSMRMKVRFYFGHVRTYSWLHELRNTQGKIYGTYLENIWGIYEEYIRNIHKYLWYKMIRNTDPMGRPPKAAAPLGRRRRRRLCSWLFYSIDIQRYSLCIPFIFHIYFLNMLQIFSFASFWIYRVNRRQVLVSRVVFLLFLQNFGLPFFKSYC